MFGVILWADSASRKAVIWCEDQGDLAYLDAAPRIDDVCTLFFETGDYVEFDVTQDVFLRRASNAVQIVPGERSAHQVGTDRQTKDGPGRSTIVNLADHWAAVVSQEACFSRLG